MNMNVRIIIQGTILNRNVLGFTVEEYKNENWCHIYCFITLKEAMECAMKISKQLD